MTPKQASDQAYYRRNRERLLEYQTTYAAKFPDKIKKRSSQYRKKNAEQLAVKKKARYEANKVAVLEAQRVYRIQNKEAIAARRKDYSDRNKAAINERRRQAYEQSRPIISERARAKYHANKEPFSKRAKIYYMKNSDRIKQQAKRYFRDNFERIKDANYRKAYGISLDDYQRMYSEQNGQCAICEIPKRVLHVDHDHSTGIVRALLCPQCNAMLGQARENPDTLVRGVAYLAQHQTRVVAA